MADRDNGKRYTDEQRAEFLEVASEIGIAPAMRQLGFPAGWTTGQRWMQAAGIEIPLDAIKALAKAHDDWYQTEHVLLVAEEGIKRVHEELQRTKFTPDEHKKMSEALQKYANTWRLLQDKATNITETHSRDGMDLEIVDLLNSVEAKNARIEQEVESDR